MLTFALAIAINRLPTQTRGGYCESARSHVIAMVETIIGNISHLSKNAILDYSC
jgi:hypothetical protein